MVRTIVCRWLLSAAGGWHFIIRRRRPRPHACALMCLLLCVLLPRQARLWLTLVLHPMSGCAASRSVLPRVIVI